MTSPFQLIQEFNKEEKHHFKLFVKNSTSKKDTKLNSFLTLIYNGHTSKVICEELYGTYPNMAFYALRKRLTHLVLEYYATHRDKELDAEQKDIQLHFEAGKKLVLNKKYKLGFECLNKALNKSEHNDFTELTEKIIFELIQFAHLNSDLDLEKLMLKHKSLKKIELKQKSIAIIYARVKQEMNTYFKKSNSAEVLLKIEELFSSQNISIDRDLNYRALYQLAQLTFAASTVSRTFLADLNNFEKRIERIVKAKQPKNSGQWTFKFKLFYLLSTANYRAKKFKQSNDYLNRILKLSRTKRVALSYEFHFKIVVLKSLNINYLGENKQAFEVLNELLKTSKLPKSNKNWMDGFGVMSMILFHGKKYSSILKLYHDFKKSDKQFTEINGLEWVLRKNLILILTHFELGNIEISEELIGRFEFENQRFLSENQRVLFFLICIQKVVSNPFQAKNSHLHRFVEYKLEKKPRYEEDIFVLSFFAWLKAKMLGEDVYELTIEIVKNLGNEI